jgi:hypothetical protein
LTTIALILDVFFTLIFQLSPDLKVDFKDSYNLTTYLTVADIAPSVKEDHRHSSYSISTLTKICVNFSFPNRSFLYCIKTVSNQSNYRNPINEYNVEANKF